jgi:hypothetical protein
MSIHPSIYVFTSWLPSRIGQLTNRGNLARLLISMALYACAHTCRFCRPIGYFAPSLKEDYHPIFRDGALQCCSIVVRRNVNCEFDRGSEKNEFFIKKTFKRVLVREWSADCLSGMCAHSPPTRLCTYICSWPSVRASTPTRPKIGRLKSLQCAGALKISMHPSTEHGQCCMTSETGQLNHLP